MKNIKYIFFLLIVFILTGCIEWKTEFRVFYYSNGAVGSPPVDSKIYSSGDSIKILGKGDLQRNEDGFLGWSYYDVIYKPEEPFTMGYEDVAFMAVWDGIQFSYTINEDDEVTITRYNGDNVYGRLTIPDTVTINEKTVIEIGDNAFSGKYIYTLNLPNNLKHIGRMAFDSNYINRITIPNSVESIGVGAFRNNDLERIDFGSGLNAIAPLTFMNNNLKGITIPENITSIGMRAFQENNIDHITIGANVDIEDETSFGTYGASFKEYYDANGKQAGAYFSFDENDIISWERY